MWLPSDSVDVEGETLKVPGRLFARARSIPLQLNAQVRQLDGELKIRSGHHRPTRKDGHAVDDPDADG